MCQPVGIYQPILRRTLHSQNNFEEEWLRRVGWLQFTRPKMISDGLLGLDMPRGIETVWYTDDLAIIVRAKDEKDLESRANTAVENFARWMETHQLALAPAKTEVVHLLDGKKGKHLARLSLRGYAIQTKREVKYLGVILDQGLTFAPYIRRALDKAR